MFTDSLKNEMTGSEMADFPSQLFDYVYVKGEETAKPAPRDKNQAYMHSLQG